MKSLFQINRALHRDIGYLLVGLVITYVISGVAVNHFHDWNPNYFIEKETHALTTDIELLPDGSLADEKAFAEKIKSEYEIKEIFRNAFQPTRDVINLYFEESVVRVNIPDKKALLEVARPRTFFYAINFLHLNKSPDVWKWIADAFAILLGYLAISGLFMLKGRNGFWSRGVWLTAIGLLIPVIAYIVL